jgi:hypothetical protein
VRCRRRTARPFHFRRLAQLLLEPLAFGLLPLLLGDVPHCSNEVDVARFVSQGMGHDVEMFDPAIQHSQSILMSKIPPLVRCALDDLPDGSNIFRVNPLEHEIKGGRGRPVQLKDPEGFL